MKSIEPNTAAIDPFHELGVWLNKHMPADNPRDWLRGVLDSVPEEEQLLTALALSVARRRHEIALKQGISGGCALCVYYVASCGACRCDLCPARKLCDACKELLTLRCHMRPAGSDQEVKAAGALYKGLKRLCAEEWMRVKGPEGVQ